MNCLYIARHEEETAWQARIRTYLRDLPKSLVYIGFGPFPKCGLTNFVCLVVVMILLEKFFFKMLLLTKIETWLDAWWDWNLFDIKSSLHHQHKAIQYLPDVHHPILFIWTVCYHNLLCNMCTAIPRLTWLLW